MNKILACLDQLEVGQAELYQHMSLALGSPSTSKVKGKEIQIDEPPTVCEQPMTHESVAEPTSKRMNPKVPFPVKNMSRTMKLQLERRRKRGPTTTIFKGSN